MQHTVLSPKEKVAFFAEKVEEINRKIDEGNPNIRAMIFMGVCFREMDLPIKHLGKINIDVNDYFWSDEFYAKASIKSFCEGVKKIYNMIEDNFGENVKYIFPDMIKGMSFKYS